MQTAFLRQSFCICHLDNLAIKASIDLAATMQSAVQHDGSLQHAGGPEDSQKVWIRVHPSRGQGERFGGGSASRRVRRDSGGDNDWWRSKYKWSGGKGD